MQDIADGDKPTYDMICRADTVGVFQIESRAQMSMLPRLLPRCYYDLVVEVAIVRPGPIQGGMVHPYLKNRTLRDDEIDCPEELKPALLRTKGVPIFQEQVMQIAMLGRRLQRRRGRRAAPRDGGVEAARRPVAVPQAPGRQDGREGLHARVRRAHLQADPGLRRVRLSGEPRRRLRAARLRQQLDQVPPPDAFLCGLLNAQPMGFYAPAQLVRDAREHGVEVRPVDVAVSAWESTLEGDVGAAPARSAARAARAARCASRSGSASTASRAWPRTPASASSRRAATPASPTAKTWRGAPARRACARRARRGGRAAEPHRPSPPGGVGGRRHRHAADRDAARDARARAARCPRRAERRRGDRWPTTAPSA
jgi:hypothetical protein